MIHVTGGTKKQREAAFNAASFSWKELFPRINNCSIDIVLLKLEGRTGDCFETDDREFEIRVDKTQDFEDFMTCIMHEMVHVKQHIRNEMKDYNYTTYEEYVNHPAEVEAYKMQEELFSKWKNGCFTAAQ